MTEPTDTQTTQSPKQKLIGLSGLAGSGKTTVAVELVNIFRYNGLSAVRLSFADPIKEAVAAIYAYAGEDACIEADLYGSAKNESRGFLMGKTPRHALQTLGSEWGRDCIGEGFWTAIGLNRALKTPAKYIIFDDVRFEHEHKAIEALGGTCFHIVRGGLDRGAHVSEGYAAGQDVYNEDVPMSPTMRILAEVGGLEMLQKLRLPPVATAELKGDG